MRIFKAVVILVSVGVAAAALDPTPPDTTNTTAIPRTVSKLVTNPTPPTLRQPTKLATLDNNVGLATIYFALKLDNEWRLQ